VGLHAIMALQCSSRSGALPSSSQYAFWLPRVSRTVQHDSNNNMRGLWQTTSSRSSLLKIKPYTIIAAIAGLSLGIAIGASFARILLGVTGGFVVGVAFGAWQDRNIQ
ncbi:MAG: hypothetical protein ACREMT_04325, partial [Vulcanimicrobiaceae bacterium]